MVETSKWQSEPRLRQSSRRTPSIRGQENPKARRETFRSIQFWITAVVLMLAPLFFGSVDLFWVSVWTILLSVGVLTGIGVELSAGQSRVLLAFLLLCAAYALVSFLQVAPLNIDSLTDPIWKRANQLLGTDVAPRISSRAEIPYLAIGHLMVFAAAFVNGFFIGTSRSGSARLFKVAGLSVMAYVIYGFLALVFTPNMLLWAYKTAYRGSFTSTFINHNTAATYVGAGAILWIGAALSMARSIRGSSLRAVLLLKSNEAVAMRLIFRSICALACVFALLKTGSRGGLICSAVGLLVAAGLLFANKLKMKPLHIVGVMLTAFAIMVFLLARMDRIASQGVFDGGRWSVYSLVLEAIGQRPLLGWGNGTFSDFFPALRNDSVWNWGVWDLAHSTILELAVEMGLPMAGAVLVAVIISLAILARAAVIADRSDRRLLAAISGISVLSFLHALIDFSLQIPGYLIVFGILLGCGLSRATTAKPVKARSTVAEAAA